MGKFTTLPRSTWDKLAPIGPKAVYPTGPADTVWLHNTAGNTQSPTSTQSVECARIDAIQRYHTDKVSDGGRNWSDIAYSFMVAPSGRRYTCRGWLRSHGANLGASNYNSISICLLGNYDIQVPTPNQILSVQELIQEGLDNGSILKGYVLLGHRDEPAPKTCPGTKITTYVPFKPVPSEDSDMTPEQEEKLDKVLQKTIFLEKTIKNWKAAGWDGQGIADHLGTDMSTSDVTTKLEDIDDAEHLEG